MLIKVNMCSSVAICFLSASWQLILKMLSFQQMMPLETIKYPSYWRSVKMQIWENWTGLWMSSAWCTSSQTVAGSSICMTLTTLKRTSQPESVMMIQDVAFQVYRNSKVTTVQWFIWLPVPLKRHSWESDCTRIQVYVLFFKETTQLMKYHDMCITSFLWNFETEWLNLDLVNKNFLPNANEQ